MHDDEIDIDAELVRRLLAAQFAHLTDLPIREVRSTGTVNAIYRIGDHLAARLPRVRRWASGLEREFHWLPRLAPHVSLLVPEPVAQGRPDSTYPSTWAIYRWIDGQPYADEIIDDEDLAARDLARFVAELRQITPDGAPPAGRQPLRELDDVTREAIEAARAVIDADAVVAAWERALQAPEWVGTPVWVHADLLRPNLLVRHSRLRAVIDFGSVGVGDPAADVIAAWSVFGHRGRETFCDALAVDDATRDRARGYALHQAALIIPYYAQSNPGFVTSARRTIEQVLADGPM